MASGIQALAQVLDGTRKGCVDLRQGLNCGLWQPFKGPIATLNSRRLTERARQIADGRAGAESTLTEIQHSA